MPANITVGSATIDLFFNTSNLSDSNLSSIIGKKLGGISKSLPINKQILANLKEQISKQRDIIKEDVARINGLRKLSALSAKIGLAGVGAIGGGLKAFLQTTDPMAKKLAASMARVKASFWNLMANVGKLATVKFGLIDKLEKLNRWMNNLTKEDIGKFFNAVKIALAVSAFAKMAMYAFQIKKYFDSLTLAKLLKEMVAVKAASAVGGAKGVSTSAAGSAVGSAVGAGAGAGLGVAVAFKVNAIMGILSAKLFLLGNSIFRASQFSKGAILPLERLGLAIANLGRKGFIKFTGKASSIAIGAGGGAGAAVGGSVGIFSKLGSVIKKLVSGPMAILLVLFGLIFAQFGKGETTIEKTKSGIGKLWNVIKLLGTGVMWVFSTIGKVLGTIYSSIALVFNMLGRVIGGIAAAVTNLFSLVVELIKSIKSGDLTAARQEFLMFNEAMKAAFNFSGDIDQFKKDFADLWKKPSKTKLDKNLPQEFGSVSGGFADLNKMFQSMFEENVTQLLANATDENTKATKENTSVLESVKTAIQDGKAAINERIKHEANLPNGGIGKPEVNYNYNSRNSTINANNVDTVYSSPPFMNKPLTKGGGGGGW